MPTGLTFPFHHESVVPLNAPPETAFAFLDDFRQLSAHMGKRSIMMMGSKMSISTDALEGRATGSRIRMEGRVLGMNLSLEEVVTERVPPFAKVWQTVDATLMVIGQYRLGILLAPTESGSRLRVIIDYDLPSKGAARWLGKLFGKSYARWCTKKIARDAARRFGPTRDQGAKQRHPDARERGVWTG